jgi:PAS domain S-box-containing protein
MVGKSKRPATSGASLRRGAEELLSKAGGDAAALPAEDIRILVHELQVHQVELEMQNDELKRTQLELHHSRDKYSELYEFAPVGYLTLDAEGAIREANLAAANILELDPGRLTAGNLCSLIAAESQDAFYLHRRSVLATQRKQTCELRMRSSSGEPLLVWLQSIARPEGPEGKPSIFTALVDITARRKAEDQLRALNTELEQRVAERTTELATASRALERSELEFRTLAANVPALFGYVDAGERYRFVNRRYEQMFGVSAEQIVGRTVRELFGLQSYLALKGPIAKTLGGEAVSHETELHFPDRLRTMSLTYVPDFDEQGRISGLFILGADVSERRALERQALQVAEHEQQRIGQDLHDGAGQELTGLGLLARSLVDSLESIAPKQAEVAARIADGLKAAMRQIRAVIHGLAPVPAGGDGLAIALAELAARTNDLPGLSCSFDRLTGVEVHDPFVASHLYRIAQEAIANAIKHGRAARIQIRLTQDHGAIKLAIIDDGRGLHASDAEREGMGLRLMHYRARLSGGSLTVGPADPRGTCVTCILGRPAHG